MLQYSYNKGEVMSILEKTFEDAMKMSYEELCTFVQAHIDECSGKIKSLQDSNNVYEKRSCLELTSLKHNLQCVLITIKEIIDDTEFCHNEAFSYRYQVPSLSLIEEADKRIKRNRGYVYSKLKNCIMQSQ